MCAADSDHCRCVNRTLSGGELQVLHTMLSALYPISCHRCVWYNNSTVICGAQQLTLRVDGAGLGIREY